MERDVLAGFLNQGLSLDEIGRRVGRHPSTVSYWLAKHGLEAVNKARHAPRGPISRTELELLVAEGCSIAELALHYERGAASIRYWLEKYGLTTMGGTTRMASRVARAAGETTLQRVCRHHGLTIYLLEARGSFRCRQCRMERVSRRRRYVKETLVTEAGGACRLCGYNRCMGALQFHHLDPATKEFELSANGVARSLARAREEARKCVVLCANCHAEVEAGLVAVTLK